MKELKKFLGVLVVGLVATVIPDNVKAAEMSKEFKSFLNEKGEFVVNASKGTTEEDLALYLDFTYTNADLPYYICWDNVSKDLNSFDFSIRCHEDDNKNKETHTVKIKYNYNEKVNKTINNYLESTLKGKTEYKVSDLELVSYWINNLDGPNDVLALYSGELKKLLDYKNIELFADGRAGIDDKFITSNMGFGTFQNNGIIYKIYPKLGATAKHIIYIDEKIGNTKEEVIKAVQKRIDDYFGKGKVNISFGGDNAYKLYMDKYNSTISELQAIYDEIKLDFEQAQTNEELYCDENNYNEELCSQYSQERASLELGLESRGEELEWEKQYRQHFLDNYNDEEGTHYFLKEALNDWYFIAEVTTEDATSMYHFTVQKDSSKMVEPIIKTRDVDTNIEISTTKTLPLDTTIQVSELTKGDEYERITKILDLTDKLTFDLNLYSNSLDKYITKLDDGTFEVKIPIPENFKGQDLVVYYVGEDDKTEEYKVEIKDGYAVFNTTHFSTYTLGYKNDSTIENPETFDGISKSILMTTISLIGLVITSIYLNKRNKSTI